MKRATINYYRGICLFTSIAMLIFCVACKKAEEKPRTIEMTVHPAKFLIAPLPPYAGPPIVPGFSATSNAFNPQTQNFSVGAIEGFVFEEGYEQVLRVEMTKDPADLQDSRGFCLKLVSVISKTKK